MNMQQLSEQRISLSYQHRYMMYTAKRSDQNEISNSFSDSKLILIVHCNTYDVGEYNE